MTATPEERMGVFKRLSEVPQKYRLNTHTEAYEGRNVWGEYEEWYRTEYWPTGTERTYRRAERTGERWQEFMRSRPHHHALARPMDVERFFEGYADEYTLSSLYSVFWCHLERFYSWLQFHPDHPHVYHPVWMAAAMDGVASQIWQFKVTHR